MVLSYPEEVVGKTISWVHAGSSAVNFGFTDGTFYSLKLQEVTRDEPLVPTEYVTWLIK